MRVNHTVSHIYHVLRHTLLHPSSNQPFGFALVVCLALVVPQPASHAASQIVSQAAASSVSAAKTTTNKAPRLNASAPSDNEANQHSPPINHGIDILRYQADLTPDLTAKTIAGKVTIQFQVTQHNVSQLTLSALDKVIHSVQGKMLSQHQVTDQQLILHFKPGALQQGQQYTVDVEYLATPQKGVRFYPDHMFTLYHTENWLVSHQNIADRAQSEIWLNLPSQLTAVANGQLISSQKLGQITRHHYLESRDRPIFTFGFAAGQFKQQLLQHRDMTFRYLYRDATTDEINRMFADVADSYDFFSSISGCDYVNRKKN